MLYRLQITQKMTTQTCGDDNPTASNGCGATMVKQIALFTTT